MYSGCFHPACTCEVTHVLVVNIPDAAPLSSADFFSTVVVISFSTSSSSMARPLIVSMGEIKLQARFNPGLLSGQFNNKIATC